MKKTKLSRQGEMSLAARSKSSGFVGWFELSVLADTQSLMQRETLKVLMARAA